MRLIDADAFKDYIRNALEETKHMYKDNGEWAKEITESFCKDIDEQPTIADISEHLVPVTKEEVLRAGYEGRETKFRLRGRLFAIRELAQ